LSDGSDCIIDGCNLSSIIERFVENIEMQLLGDEITRDEDSCDSYYQLDGCFVNKCI
jgi:hypothetical protein